MFKPTEVTTPKSESSNIGAPNTGQPGDPAAIAAPRDPEKSRFQPVEIETPQSETFNETAPGTGQPGDGRQSDSGYGLHASQAQRQSVKDDRGGVTTFISDLPQK